MSPGVLCALGAAALFGANTPFAKLLLGEVSPLVFAAGGVAGPIPLKQGLARTRITPICTIATRTSRAGS
jgi:drug/metabolite transporter (DMT)-like permease